MHESPDVHELPGQQHPGQQHQQRIGGANSGQTASSMSCVRSGAASFTPATFSICISEGSFNCDRSHRCDIGLYSSQLILELPTRDKAPTVRALVAHLHRKAWGKCLQQELVCFRGQAQLDWEDAATVLVGGTVDILSVQEAKENAFSNWLQVDGTGSRNTCGAGRTQTQTGQQADQQVDQQVDQQQAHKQADQQVDQKADQQVNQQADQQVDQQTDQQVDKQVVQSQDNQKLANGQWSPGREYVGEERIRTDKQTGKEWVAPIPLQADAVGSWDKGVDKAERMRRLDKLDKTVKEAIKAQDRSFDLQQHIPELWQIGSKSAKTCSACSLQKGKHSPDGGFSHSMWEREDGQRRFCRKCMKNLWCYSCGELHTPQAEPTEMNGEYLLSVAP